MDDTICAISTSLGVGAIAIVRVSGKNAIKIVNNIFKGKDLTKVDSHTINYGFIINKNKIIDEVLVSVMKSPKTYTKEDLVEINCHGGISSTNKILELLLNDCRLAEPGEFTKRAFLNGRIDLTKAEAVGDLIKAHTDQARNLAISQLTGSLSNLIKEIRKNLLNLMANIEVNIDYPEYEDINQVTINELNKKLPLIKNKLQNLLKEADNSKIIKNGLNIALVGRPNVGKSSILNKLLEEDKAIVTDIAGTTRDIVEGSIILKGVMLNFIDTAGIRSTNDKVEKIGVNKSLNVMENADLVILVLNNNEKLTKEDQKLLNLISNKKHLVFLNKSDLPVILSIANSYNIVIGNTIEKNGLDNLKNQIIEMFNLEKLNTKDQTYLTNARHISLIKKALINIDDCLTQIDNNIPIDIIEIDLKNTFDLLGEIIGQTYNDDLLKEIFANFCIGK